MTGTETKQKPQTSAWLLIALLALSGATGFAQSATAPSSKRQVVVSLPDRKLAVLQDGNIMAIFPVAVGATKSPSPTGEFAIVNRVNHPTYYHSGEVIPPGKDNPIGTRWIGLSKKGYGIHGTNAPRSIGKAASHGCIRLRNRDMERLFAMLGVGDTVKILGERDELLAQIFGNENETAVAQAHSAEREANGGQ